MEGFPHKEMLWKFKRFSAARTHSLYSQEERKDSCGCPENSIERFPSRPNGRRWGAESSIATMCPQSWKAEGRPNKARQDKVRCRGSGATEENRWKCWRLRNSPENGGWRGSATPPKPQSPVGFASSRTSKPNSVGLSCKTQRRWKHCWNPPSSPPAKVLCPAPHFSQLNPANTVDWTASPKQSLPPGLRTRFNVHGYDHSDVHWQGIYQPLHMLFGLLRNSGIKNVPDRSSLAYILSHCKTGFTPFTLLSTAFRRGQEANNCKGFPLAFHRKNPFRHKLLFP